MERRNVSKSNGLWKLFGYLCFLSDIVFLKKHLVIMFHRNPLGSAGITRESKQWKRHQTRRQESFAAEWPLADLLEYSFLKIQTCQLTERMIHEYTYLFTNVLTHQNERGVVNQFSSAEVGFLPQHLHYSLFFD